MSLGVAAKPEDGPPDRFLRTKPEGRRSWKDFRDDLVALLDALDQPPVVLSGHSMGGTVSLLAAARRPDKVSSLVLFDPDRVREVASYADPHHLSEGMDYVLLNGVVAVEEGVFTERLAGRVLRK